MLRFLLNLVLLFYGVNNMLSTDATEKQHRLFGANNIVKFSEVAQGNNKTEKGYVQKRQFYNPVLQNVSVLSDYFNTKQTTLRESRNTRKTRSTNRNCAGQCEQSLCTWREEWDEERTRVPQFIKYAVCDSPRCNFEFASLDDTAAFALQMNTYCDLVKTSMQVIERGHKKWLTDWPIACFCTQRDVHVQFSSSLHLRHPGRHVTPSQGQVDVDITSTESVDPVPRQHIVLSGVRHRSLSRAQRRRLRIQRHNMQNTESWEEVMRRKHHRY